MRNVICVYIASSTDCSWPQIWDHALEKAKVPLALHAHSPYCGSLACTCSQTTIAPSASALKPLPTARLLLTFCRVTVTHRSELRLAAAINIARSKDHRHDTYMRGREEALASAISSAFVGGVGWLELERVDLIYRNETFIMVCISKLSWFSDNNLGWLRLSFVKSCTTAIYI